MSVGGVSGGLITATLMRIRRTTRLRLDGYHSRVAASRPAPASAILALIGWVMSLVALVLLAPPLCQHRGVVGPSRISPYLMAPSYLSASEGSISMASPRASRMLSRIRYRRSSASCA